MRVVTATASRSADADEPVDDLVTVPDEADPAADAGADQATGGIDPKHFGRFLVVLGLPTFGLAFALSTVTTYAPQVLLKVADNSPGKVGALLSGEGALALGVPLLVGSFSDRLSGKGRLGKRLPFVLAGLLPAALGLLALPIAPSYFTAGVALFFFFVGYYLYYPPYRAIYADVLEPEQLARSQGNQAIQRGAGLGLALLTGGFLLHFGDEVPFLVAAGMLVALTFALRPVLRLDRGREKADTEASAASIKDLLLHNKPMALFALINVLLEASFAGLRSFVVLYVTQGLHQSTVVASAVIGVVAVSYVVGAPIAGRLADHFGVVPVMRVASVIYGVGLFCAVFATSLPPLLTLLPFIALAGSILLTLPQALAFLVAPQGSGGAAAGIVDSSRGLGTVIGPLAVGLAISNAHTLLRTTMGYGAMWPVIGILTLLATPLLTVLHRTHAADLPEHGRAGATAEG